MLSFIDHNLFRYLRTHMNILFHLRYVFQMLSSYKKFVLLWRQSYWDNGSLPAGQGISLLLRSLKIHYSLYTKYLTYSYLKPAEMRQNPQIVLLKVQF